MRLTTDVHWDAQEGVEGDEDVVCAPYGFSFALQVFGLLARRYNPSLPDDFY